MAAVNFAALVNTRLADVPPPKLFPAGAYVAKVLGFEPKTRPIGGEEVSVVNIKLAFVQPFTDQDGNSNIDQEAIAEYGGLQMIQKQDRLTYTIWLREEDGASALQKFLVNVCRADDSLSIKDALTAVRGTLIGVNIQHRQSTRPGEEGSFVASVKDVFALDVQ